MLQNPILRTKLCGTGFITQHGWVVYFRLTKVVRRKWFIPVRYQLPKGKSVGLALKYFYMIHRVGRWAWRKQLSTWKSHVTHMNQSCHTYERVMSHVWTSHVTHESSLHAHLLQWTSRKHLCIWKSHVTHMNQSCHTCEWVTSHMRMRHVTRKIDTSRTCRSEHEGTNWIFGWRTSSDFLRFLHLIWLSLRPASHNCTCPPVYAMTHSCVWHDILCVWSDSNTCVTWLIHMHGMTPPVSAVLLRVLCHFTGFAQLVWGRSKCSPSFLIHMCVTWLIHICHMTPLLRAWDLASPSSCIARRACAPVCATTHSYVWHVSLICVLHDSFVCVCGMTGSFVCDVTDLFVCDFTLIFVRGMTHSCVCDITHSFVYDMTHLYVSLDSFLCMTRRIYLCDTWRIHVCVRCLIHTSHTTCLICMTPDS